MPDVVLPVLDEADVIPWVLQRLPAGFHPIVVDNGSTDGSGRIVAALGAEVGGPAAARLRRRVPCGAPRRDRRPRVLHGLRRCHSTRVTSSTWSLSCA